MYVIKTLKHVRSNVCNTILTLQHTHEYTNFDHKHSTYLHTTFKDKNPTLHHTLEMVDKTGNFKDHSAQFHCAAEQ